MVYVFLVMWMMAMAVVCFGCHLDFSKNKKLYLKLVMISLILVMGLRNYTVGVDTVSYMHYYTIISNATFKEILSDWMYSSMEVGYCLLLKISSLFIDNYYFFQILQAIIFNILMMCFIRDNTQNYLLAYTIFLGMGMYTLSFNIARQMLAVALIANVWTVMNKGKRVQAFILLFIAISIHTASIVFVVACFVYMCRYNPKLLRFIPILVLIVGINYQRFICLAQVHFSRFSNYYSNLKDKFDAGYVQIIWLIIVIISLILIYRKRKMTNLVVLGQKEFDILDVRAKLSGVFCICYIVTQTIGMYFNYFDRVGLFFEPFVILLFECFGESIVTNSIRRFYYCALWICFVMYFLIGSLSSVQYQYSFFFV